MSENIKQLSEKEKVRKKISVWLGSSNHMAVLHCIKELIGNSADEIGKGNGDRIELILHEDGKTVTIKDNCKGLPIEGINDNGTPNYELLFEHLFAGTKYDNGIGNNHYTVGSNGLFLAILTYSSEKVDYKIARPNGKVYEVSYKKGVLNKPFKEVGESDSTFTEITFELDDEVFEGNYYTFNEISEIAKEQASLLQDGVITVESKADQLLEEYSYGEGIIDFLEQEISSLSNVSEIALMEKELSHTLEKEGTVDDIKIKMAFNYTKEDEDNTRIEFLNGSNLIHHGTIYEGLVNGLRSSIHKYLKDGNMYKKAEKQISKEDVMVGLNYVVDFKSYFPVYASQTKFASEVTYYKEVMQEAIKDFFDSYVLENKFEMERIANQVIGEKRARESADKVRMNVKKKLSGNINTIENKVEGFYNCKSKDRDKNVLTVCEGKSALSAMLSGRQDIHAIYPLRGKVLNCLKASLESAINNEVIGNLLKILGCGVEVGKDKGNFNIDNLRFSKIMIYVDSDYDGKGSILPLLLTAFWKLVPTLVKQGRIYICETPKYEVVVGDNMYYAVDDEEFDKLRVELEGEKYSVHYIKGLAELSSEAMAMCMHPDYKNITQVTMKNVEESIKALDVFMGNSITERKNIILESFEGVEEDGERG